MRELMKEGVASSVLSTSRAIQYLFDIMEQEGPFEGIIGYSEGATVAGTLLLAEQRRRDKLGRQPMIKCAIFFAGWPPLDPTTFAMILSDQSDTLIDIHTCHISTFSNFENLATRLTWNKLGRLILMWQAPWHFTTHVNLTQLIFSTTGKDTPYQERRAL